MKRYIAPFAPLSWSWAERLLLIQVLVLASINSIRGIRRSLWVDESLTYWVSEGSFTEMLTRAIHHQGQMPLFFSLTWLSANLFGAHEVALRLPSVLAYLMCTFFVYRIGLALHGREAGLIAAFCFHGMWAMTYGAPDARPYTTALLWLLVSTYLLIRWSDVGRGSYLVGYVVSLLAAIYTNLLFTPVLFVHAVYVALRGLPAKVYPRQISLGVAALVGGLVPVGFLMLMLRAKWELYSFAPMPSVSELLTAWIWVVLIAGTSGGLIITRQLFATKIRWSTRVGEAEWVLLWTWSLCPALLLFLASHLKGESVFVGRYFSWQVPGVALLAALILIGFAPVQLRRLLTTSYFYALVILTLFSASRAETLFHTEDHSADWRGAVDYANRVIERSDTPVLVWSGLVESKDPAWVQAAENRGYMLAPVAFYGLRGEIIPVPSPETVGTLDSFLPELAIEALASEPTILVLAPHPQPANQIASWLGSGETARPLTEQFGYITVIRVERVIPAHVPPRGGLTATARSADLSQHWRLMSVDSHPDVDAPRRPR